MKLGTMASAFLKRGHTGHDYIDALRLAKECGFDVMDPNMGSLHMGKSEFYLDNWESIAYNLRNEAEKLSMELPQAHLPFVKPITRRESPYERDAELSEEFNAMLERSIRIASILGVKWGVIHPVNVSGGLEFDFDEDIAYNHRIYDRYVELAEKLGVGLAFENLADVDQRRRFGVMPAELIALVDSFGSENVRVCWDFGHGNRTYRGDQLPALDKIGKYIRATHVDDNVGKEDLHTLPFLGTAKWDKIMKKVGEIGYDGAFVYEIRFTKKMPEALKTSAARFAAEVGRYLISQAEQQR